MQLIVLDLEWNQPTSYQSAAYRRVGDRLLFEVIQFGAAKLDEGLEIVDTISIPVNPTHYQTIHPRVRRMTGLTRDVLCDAPAFPEAMETFMDWCGEDCAFVTWGCDDVSVLQQNVDFFRVERPLPKMYDLQRLYAAEAGKSGQTALKTAMEALGVEVDEERSFHNAMHDAYYTAQVLRKLPHPMDVLRYEEQPRKLCHKRPAKPLPRDRPGAPPCVRRWRARRWPRPAPHLRPAHQAPDRFDSSGAGQIRGAQPLPAAWADVCEDPVFSCLTDRRACT